MMFVSMIGNMFAGLLEIHLKVLVAFPQKALKP